MLKDVTYPWAFFYSYMADLIYLFTRLIIEKFEKESIDPSSDL
jgi:hypothetical protein